jgi:hypothetical protein
MAHFYDTCYFVERNTDGKQPIKNKKIAFASLRFVTQYLSISNPCCRCIFFRLTVLKYLLVASRLKSVFSTIPGATHSIRPQYILAFDVSLGRRCLLTSYIVHIAHVRYPDLCLEGCLRISYTTDI